MKSMRRCRDAVNAALKKWDLDQTCVHLACGITPRSSPTLFSENVMPGAKIVVLYPRPTDVAVFERAYLEEHVPFARAKIAGHTRFVLTTVLGAVGGDPAYHRITEIHFPSMEALQASAATADTQEAAGHAIAVSSGGPPLFLIADEGEVVTMDASRPAATAVRA